MAREDTQFKPGYDPRRNNEGYVKGQKNYATLRAMAFDRIGKKKGMTAEEIEVMKIENGLVLGLNGNYSFYRDDLDRTHGKPVETTKMIVEGSMETNTTIEKQDIEAIALRVAEELKGKKVNANPDKTTTSGS